jgi:peptidyl-prolyl cis-trans isomerase D
LAGNNSAPIAIDNQHVVVLRVNQHVMPQQQELSVVENKIKQLVVHEKALTAAKQLGETMLNAKSSTQLEQLLKANQLAWQTVKSVGHQLPADKRNTDAFMHHLAFESTSTPDKLVGRATPKGFTLVQVTAIQPGSLDTLDASRRTEIQQQWLSEHSQREYSHYLSAELARAKIVRQ